MKNLSLLALSLLIYYTGHTQVGINTTHPTSTLDVAGTLRVRGAKSDALLNPIQATKIVGMDDEGNFVEVTLGENLYLESNVIKHSPQIERIYNRPSISQSTWHNAPDIIWPGGTGHGKPVVKITNSSGDLEITGIDMSVFATPMDAHGYVVTLYSVSGELKLKSEDSNSNTMNQFILSDGNDVNLKRYEMVKIMYDGQLERWLVMSKH